MVLLRRCTDMARYRCVQACSFLQVCWAAHCGGMAAASVGADPSMMLALETAEQAHAAAAAAATESVPFAVGQSNAVMAPPQPVPTSADIDELVHAAAAPDATDSMPTTNPHLTVPAQVVGTPTIVGVPAQDKNHQDVHKAFNYQYSVASAWWQQWYQWYARNHAGAPAFEPLGAIPPSHVRHASPAPHEPAAGMPGADAAATTEAGYTDAWEANVEQHSDKLTPGGGSPASSNPDGCSAQLQVHSDRPPSEGRTAHAAGAPVKQKGSVAGGDLVSARRSEEGTVKCTSCGADCTALQHSSVVTPHALCTACGGSTAKQGVTRPHSAAAHPQNQALPSFAVPMQVPMSCAPMHPGPQHGPHMQVQPQWQGGAVVAPRTVRVMGQPCFPNGMPVAYVPMGASHTGPSAADLLRGTFAGAGAPKPAITRAMHASAAPVATGGLPRRRQHGAHSGRAPTSGGGSSLPPLPPLAQSAPASMPIDLAPPRLDTQEDPLNRGNSDPRDRSMVCQVRELPKLGTFECFE